MATMARYMAQNKCIIIIIIVILYDNNSNVCTFQVSALLKPGGRFISITFTQPHFRKPLYAKSRWQWSLETRSFGEGFEYFVYVMVKGGELSSDDIAMGNRRNWQRSISENCDEVNECEDENFLLSTLDCLSDELSTL